MQFKRGSIGTYFAHDKALILWYPFEECTGTITKDLSGSAYHGTLCNGPIWTKGRFGSALSLDGSDDYVAIKSGALASSLYNCTIQAWVNWNGSGGERAIYDESESAGTVFRINLYYGIPNFSFSGYQVWYETDNSTRITPNQWHHIVAVFSNDKETGGMRIYVDGTQKGLNSNKSVCGKSIANTWIGRYGQSGYNFPGLIDEVAVFNRALSPLEISNYYLWATSISILPKKLPKAVVYTLTTGTGEFNLSGVNTRLNKILRLVVEAGQYTLTGISIGLKKVYNLIVNTGIYILTGINTGLKKMSRLVAETGQFIMTGTATGLRRAYMLIVEAGEFVFTGISTCLRKISKLIVETGEFIFTGIEMGFHRVHKLIVKIGTYVFSGVNVFLKWILNKTPWKPTGRILNIKPTGEIMNLKPTGRIKDNNKPMIK